MRRRVALAAVPVLFAGLFAGCEGDATDPDDPSTTPGKPVVLTFMVYGAPEEVEAYQSMVRSFNAEHEDVAVTLGVAKNATDALRQLRVGDVPDVFMLSRRDLSEVAAKNLNQPVSELLDARGIDFADLYKRDSIQAFSYEEQLQCMPYAISPMVIYFNTSLIDFDTMADQGLPTPASNNSWTFDQFAAAAEFATRKGIKGLYIEPSLLGIAPFVYSGGGDLFDDDHEPTSLALSSEGSREALERTLELLRKDRFTLSPDELREEDALDRFKTGKLGMIAGFRSLVPELRKTPSLSFDVMPMPSLDDEKTVGDVTGICMSAETASVGDAADFITEAISTESVAEVAEAGYLVPSNSEVAGSDAFLQPDELPAHPEVFNRSVRDVVVTPLIGSYPRLEETVHALLYQMFYAQVFDLEQLTEQIDEVSAPVIDPEAAEEAEE